MDSGGVTGGCTGDEITVDRRGAKNGTTARPGAGQGRFEGRSLAPIPPACGGSSSGVLRECVLPWTRGVRSTMEAKLPPPGHEVASLLPFT